MEMKFVLSKKGQITFGTYTNILKGLLISPALKDVVVINLGYATSSVSLEAVKCTET